MHICPSSHEIQTSADRDSQGHCLACRRGWNVSYRSRQRSALEFALALEANGIPVTRSEPPVDLQLLAATLARGYVSPLS